MIGICPNCGINLKEPPHNSRETNEVMIVLIYRRLIESDKGVPPLKETGKCAVCNASAEDLIEQAELMKDSEKLN
jgi:hypothetical protein